MHTWWNGNAHVGHVVKMYDHNQIPTTTQRCLQEGFEALGSRRWTWEKLQPLNDQLGDTVESLKSTRLHSCTLATPFLYQNQKHHPELSSPDRCLSPQVHICRETNTETDVHVSACGHNLSRQRTKMMKDVITKLSRPFHFSYKAPNHINGWDCCGSTQASHV